MWIQFTPISPHPNHMEAATYKGRGSYADMLGRRRGQRQVRREGVDERVNGGAHHFEWRRPGEWETAAWGGMSGCICALAEGVDGGVVQEDHGPDDQAAVDRQTRMKPVTKADNCELALTIGTGRKTSARRSSHSPRCSSGYTLIRARLTEGRTHEFVLRPRARERGRHGADVECRGPIEGDAPAPIDDEDRPARSDSARVRSDEMRTYNAYILSPSSIWLFGGGRKLVFRCKTRDAAGGSGSNAEDGISSSPQTVTILPRRQSISRTPHKEPWRNSRPGLSDHRPCLDHLSISSGQFRGCFG